MARIDGYKKKRPGWDDFPDVMTCEDVAALMDFEIHTVRKFAMSGQIPATRFGREWRIDKAALMSKMQSNAIIQIEQEAS